jgi:hypothetical protein
MPVSHPKQDGLNAMLPLNRRFKRVKRVGFAHQSAHTSYNDVFELAAVSPNDLHFLTDLSLNIANCLLLAHGLQEQCFIELP